MGTYHGDTDFNQKDFARESLRFRTVLIPTEITELSAEWFSDVLKKHTPTVVVSEVSPVSSHTGTTGRVIVKVKYDSNPAPLPSSFFCKMAPFNPTQRKLLEQFGIGAVEAHFYKDLAVQVGLRVPTSYHADYTDEGRFIMVLEDLDAMGCSFRRSPIDEKVTEALRELRIDRARATVMALAPMHAAFWNSPRFDTDLSWVPKRAGFGDGIGKDPMTIAASSHFAKKALSKFGDEMPKAFSDVGKLYAERTADILDLWDAGPRTLIHGDTHEGNLFDDDHHPGFFDWAMFSNSPALRDISYHLASSLDEQDRRDCEWQLVSDYAAALRSLGPSIDDSTVDSQYRIFAVFAWVSMAATAAMGSQWQPIDYGLRAMRRATAAVSDLGSVDIVRDAL